MLAACRYFASERWDISAATEANSDPSRFELFIVLAGSGKIEWEGGSVSYKQGECWFIPAQLGKFSITPNAATSILRTYVPDADALRAKLLREGAAEAALQKVFFP